MKSMTPNRREQKHTFPQEAPDHQIALHTAGQRDDADERRDEGLRDVGELARQEQGGLEDEDEGDDVGDDPQTERPPARLHGVGSRDGCPRVGGQADGRGYLLKDGVIEDRVGMPSFIRAGAPSVATMM